MRAERTRRARARGWRWIFRSGCGAAGLAWLLAAPVDAGPKAPRLCADGDGCTQTLVPPPAAKNLNPGHYMLPYLGETQSGLLARANEVCKENALKGLQVRQYWGSLESTSGQYTFENVEQLYERLAACKKRLVLQVMTVKFGSNAAGLAPLGLESLVAPTSSGYIVKLWEPAVMDRVIALHEALGRRFDAEPYFEGVVMAETATSGVKSGYSARAYIEQLERAAKAVRAAWARSSVIVYANFLQGAEISEFVGFVHALEKIGVGIGGPDVLPPPHGGSTGERIYRGELGGIDLRGRMLAGFAVQSAELGGREGTFTPRELYDHCAKTNRCKYMFWVRNTSSGGPEQQWSTGILPFLRAHPAL